MKRVLLEQALAERDAGRPAALVTALGTGIQSLVTPDRVEGDLALGGDTLAAVRRVLIDDRSGSVEAGGERLFVQIFNPPLRLILVGAVHISQALAPIAKLLGYDVTIVDPRTAFATDERFPDVKVIAQWPDEALPPLGERAAPH